MSETGAGTLNVACHKCQFSGYAKPGTKAARLIRAALRPDEDAAPAPAPEPAPAPPPARKVKASTPTPPAPAPRVNSVFSMESLR